MARKLSSEEIYEAIRKKYADVSRSAEGKFKYTTGKAGAEALGYDLSIVSDVPEEVFRSFCGVGNPFSPGQINPGETVLDVGCGTGFDLAYAAHLVGPSGHVSGIDLTPEMVEKAVQNLTNAGVSNAEVQLAGSGPIPYDNHTFDVIISNGVLNLSPCKDKTFSEIFRILKPDGRFQFADVVLKDNLPEKVVNSLDHWTG